MTTPGFPTILAGIMLAGVSDWVRNITPIAGTTLIVVSVIILMTGLAQLRKKPTY